MFHHFTHFRVSITSEECFHSTKKKATLVCIVTKTQTPTFEHRYEWEKNRIVFDDHCGTHNVLATVFRDNVTFVTAVMDDMYFWGPDPVSKYRKRKAHFGRIGQPQPVTCVGTMGASEKILVSGTKSGHVFLWIERLDKRAKFASGFGIASHASNIRWSKDDRYIIVTGGRDRTVLVWRVDELIEQQKKSSSSSSSESSSSKISE